MGSSTASNGRGRAAPVQRAKSAKAFKVLVVDDHELVRTGLVNLLAGDPEFTVIGEANSGQDAIDQVKSLSPDLVLMDVRMPGMDGLAAMRAVKEFAPEVSVIIVTMYDDVDYLLEAIRSGAAGYMLKDSTRKQLTDAVRNVLNGESSIDPRLSGELLRRLAGEAPRSEKAAAIDALTAREREVVAHIAEGETNAQIAEALIVSRSTVKAHVEHIISKLGVSDRTQAAVRAIQLGIVEGPSS